MKIGSGNINPEAFMFLKGNDEYNASFGGMHAISS
jgi:hypothetical protein